jgi:hypothetical protein
LLRESLPVELVAADLTVAPDRPLLGADVTELMPAVTAAVVCLTTPLADDATSLALGGEDDPLTIGPRMMGSRGLAASGTSGGGGVVCWLLTDGETVETGVERVGVAVSVGVGFTRAC